MSPHHLWIKATLTSDFIQGIQETFQMSDGQGIQASLDCVPNMTIDKQYCMKVMCSSIKLVRSIYNSLQ